MHTDTEILTMINELAEAKYQAGYVAGLQRVAMAMKNKDGKLTREWSKFQCYWARPGIIHRKTTEGN